MPKTVKELSPSELNKSLEKSLLRVKKMLKGKELKKSKWEKEPGTAASWEIAEGRDRAGGSKDASTDSEIQSKYDNDELENRLLGMQETGQEGEMADEPWQEGDKILGPGKTEVPDTPKGEAPFNRKAKVDIKKSIKKAMNKAIKKALKKAAKSERREEEEEHEDEEREDKMKKSFDAQEAEIAIDASPFLRKMDKKQKKLQKSVKSQAKATKKLRKLQKAQAQLSVASMELTKAYGAQPLPRGSMLRKSGNGKPMRASYDPSRILQKSQDLVVKGKITPLDGIKIEEWVNGVRAELPENLVPLFTSVN